MLPIVDGERKVLMKIELHNYDVFPKVFLVNEEAHITIKPLGKHAAFPQTLKVAVSSMLYGLPAFYPDITDQVIYDVTSDADGCVRFTHTFKEESEYRLMILREGIKPLPLCVYALEEDMKGRYPFRGDLHMHTFRSDGDQDPAVVVADYRRHGYDFTVISDHNRYYPSLEAMDAFKDVDTEMTIVTGEEVHLPDNDIHIVNFGGKYSVNGLVETSPQNLESDRRSVIDNPPAILTEEEYRAEINALISELDIPEGVPAFTYAACVWIFNHIRKGDGLGIFAHPYWIQRNTAFQVPEKLLDHMMKTQPFDAFEVLGGERYFQHNGFQTIRYYEDRARGYDYPIVGSTDSHCSLAQNVKHMIGSTFVFAPQNERASLIQSIKEKYSIAIDTISEEYRLVGDLRLAKYARFLLDEFTPLHDELCYEEGRLMKAYAMGEEGAKEALNFIHGRMAKLYKKYFAI